MKVVVYGNAGSGKTTVARRLMETEQLSYLSLDDITWKGGPERRPLEESLADLRTFQEKHERWVVEGCYGDLVEALLPECTELLFLNPGVASCLDNCRQRAWEPDKFTSKEEQDAMLSALLDWVGEYPERDDEFGLPRHRQIFDTFAGPKREFRSLDAYRPSGS